MHVSCICLFWLPERIHVKIWEPHKTCVDSKTLKSRKSIKRPKGPKKQKNKKATKKNTEKKVRKKEGQKKILKKKFKKMATKKKVLKKVEKKTWNMFWRHCGIPGPRHWPTQKHRNHQVKGQTRQHQHTNTSHTKGMTSKPALGTNTHCFKSDWWSDCAMQSWHRTSAWCLKLPTKPENQNKLPENLEMACKIKAWKFEKKLKKNRKKKNENKAWNLKIRPEIRK